MQVFQINHPDVPGHLRIVAESGHSAGSIFCTWFRARFDRDPMKFMIEDISSELLQASRIHRAACASAAPGVAYAIGEHGWIVAPPEIEAPGPYHLSAHPAECYKFVMEADDTSVHILARTAGDAWHIYHVWVREHGLQSVDGNRAELRLPDHQIVDNLRIARAAALGITGVVSRRLTGWDVLPPWDEAAGDH